MNVLHYCPQNVADLPSTLRLESPSVLQLAIRHCDIILMLIWHSSLLDLIMCSYLGQLMYSHGLLPGNNVLHLGYVILYYYMWCVQVLRSPKEAFAAAMQSWRERCEKCVCLQGDYVEK